MIDNHTINSISIDTYGGFVQSTVGPIVIILHQYAYLSKGNKIHSAIQMEQFKNNDN